MESREHVEKHKSGATVCRHCGGEVGEDGYSMAGLIMDESSPDREGPETEQHESTERMRDAAFAKSLRGGR